MIEGRWTGEAKYQALLAVARSLLEEENLALREEIEASAAAGGIIGASVSLARSSSGSRAWPPPTRRS